MKKSGLLTTTAIVAAMLTFAAPAHAEEKGWFDSMQYKVQSWFGKEDSANAEVEAYLDEVTIAVPPMTGEDAAAIQPAAGGDAGEYVEEVEDQINNVPAPGSMQYDQSSQFNTEFDASQGSSVAFGDTPSADDLANIMPAAGENDAEEITDDSVIVVEGDTTVEADTTTEADTTAEDDMTAETEAEIEMDAETETTVE